MYVKKELQVSNGSDLFDVQKIAKNGDSRAWGEQQSGYDTSKAGKFWARERKLVISMKMTGVPANVSDARNTVSCFLLISRLLTMQASTRMGWSWHICMRRCEKLQPTSVRSSEHRLHCQYKHTICQVATARIT